MIFKNTALGVGHEEHLLSNRFNGRLRLSLGGPFQARVSPFLITFPRRI